MTKLRQQPYPGPQTDRALWPRVTRTREYARDPAAIYHQINLSCGHSFTVWVTAYKRGDQMFCGDPHNDRRKAADNHWQSVVRLDVNTEAPWADGTPFIRAWLSCGHRFAVPPGRDVRKGDRLYCRRHPGGWNKRPQFGGKGKRKDRTHERPPQSDAAARGPANLA
jgi:hypothetical protein